ncbi:magnesium transporter, partial [Thermodesulfobacteriota bacterium]
MLREKPLILFETVRRLLRRGASVNLKNVFKKTHSADIAAILRHLSVKERSSLFDLLEDPERAAEVLSETDAEVRIEIIEGMTVERTVEILRAMSADDEADIIGSLPEDLSASILDFMKEEDHEEVEELLKYDEDTAGGIMTPDYFALPGETTVAEAIAALQKETEAEMVFYIYVVDDPGHLIGVLSLRQLLMNPPEALLLDIVVKDVLSVRTDMDQEEVARIVARYNILAVPVVDEMNMLVGIVTVDDVIDVIREEATEDILKMAGATDDDALSRSTIKRARTRLPWLFAAFFGGLVAIEIIKSFEETLNRAWYLAAFIPIILGMGGNIGNQSLAMIIRGLATGRVDLRETWKLILKETWVGMSLGL